MKKWTIAYQYWQIIFCRADIPAEEGYVLFTDHVEAAVRHLVEQRENVWVRITGDMRQVVQYFMNHYIYIKAAGGLVRNGDRLLLIDRNQHWDMAKGKVEPGETLACAALREVQEETGLQHIELGPLALKTYHIYDLYGGWHLKQTSWHHMRSSDQRLTPQTEEGIASAEWTPLPEARRRLAQSYSMMRLLSEKI